MVAQVDQAPGADPVPLGIGTAQDMRLEGRLLALAQPLGPAAARPVVQALGTFGVEAQDGIAQGLPFHSGQPRRFSPRHAVERVGQR